MIGSTIRRVIIGSVTHHNFNLLVDEHSLWTGIHCKETNLCVMNYVTQLSAGGILNDYLYHINYYHAMHTLHKTVLELINKNRISLSGDRCILMNNSQKFVTSINMSLYLYIHIEKSYYICGNCVFLYYYIILYSRHSIWWYTRTKRGRDQSSLDCNYDSAGCCWSHFCRCLYDVQLYQSKEKVSQ